MILLDSATKSLELVLAGTPATTQPDFVVGYMDLYKTEEVPASNAGALTGLTPVVALAAPGVDVKRRVDYLSIYNADTASVTLTVRYNTAGTRRTLWKGTLLAGESLVYVNNVGWTVQAADGTDKIVGPQVGSGGVGVIEGSSVQRVLRSGARWCNDLLVTADKAYWVYLGRTALPITVKYIEFGLTVVAVGTVAAEVALASSPNPPNKGAQTLTKIAATGTLSTLLATLAVKRNTNSLAAAIPAGTHLWAGFRANFGTTQPTLQAIGDDMEEGNLLETATAGALTGAGPWTGTVIPFNAVSGTGVCPDLRAVLD